MAFKVDRDLIKKGDPTFIIQCLDFEEILDIPANVTGKEALDLMEAGVRKQSENKEAWLRADPTRYKDRKTEDCKAYIGAWAEYIGANILNFYAHQFNVENFKLTDSIGSTTKDYGVDGMGQSSREWISGKTKRKTVAGAPIYFQSKWTADEYKIFKANDGSRLTNFGMRAGMDRSRGVEFYDRERYVVFVGGKDIHWSLDQMSYCNWEVYNRDDIAALMTRPFINYLRKNVGLTTVELPELKNEADDRFGFSNDEYVSRTEARVRAIEAELAEAKATIARLQSVACS